MFVATRREGAVTALNNDRIHRQVLMPVYLPALLLAVPGQAVWILLPLYVLELGGSPAAAATVVGLRGVGMMAADIPAGMLAARFGDRSVMVCSIVLMGAAYLGFALVERVQPLYAIAFVYGTGASSYLLGRMSYITDACAAAQRGRVIAMVAGSMRASALVGPLAGGALAEFAGFKVAFLGGGACVFLGLLCVTVFAHRARPAGAAPQVRAVVRLALEHRRVFATAGIAAIVFMLMRSARTLLMPLLGADLGLAAASIGLVVSLAAVVDVLMFYPAGVIMDKHGRRATAVPSSILFAVAIASMSLAQGFVSLLGVAVLVGLANGLSTGIIMTLGTDHAPHARRGEFLGLWRLLTDVGTTAGPMAIAAVVAVAPIYTAALVIAAVGAAGSFIIYRFVEETLAA